MIADRKLNQLTWLNRLHRKASAVRAPLAKCLAKCLEEVPFGVLRPVSTHAPTSARRAATHLGPSTSSVPPTTPRERSP